MNPKLMRCRFYLSDEEEAFLNRLINNRALFDSDDRETRKAMALQYLITLALAAAMADEREQHAAQSGASSEAAPDWLSALTV